MTSRFAVAVLAIPALLLVGCAPSGTTGTPSPGAVTGTVWRLIELDGNPAVQGADATLELSKEGKASGRGSCNRFSGTVAISGDRIEFGPLASTKMACVDAAATAQETKYLDALQKAERFELDGSTLLIYSAASEKPLRFSPK
jgi:heat shock protein HslJ